MIPCTIMLHNPLLLSLSLLYYILYVIIYIHTCLQYSNDTQAHGACGIWMHFAQPVPWLFDSPSHNGIQWVFRTCCLI